LNPSIIRLTETNSTNSYALELLLRSRPQEGCVIVTDHQTRGKGTDANTWESKKGMNLTFSIILYPPFTADKQFLLNKAISLGICNFLRTEIPQHTVTIKWPNDIYIGDKKVCGILIQNSVIGNHFEYVVVGIGLNVNQTLFESDAPNPVSLKMTTGINYDLEKLLQNLLQFIFRKYNLVNPETSILIENEYNESLYRLMEWHEYIVAGKLIIARITGTNAYGQLVLESEIEEALTCDLKEVKFVI